MKLNTNYVYKDYKTELFDLKTDLNKQKEDYSNTKEYLISKLFPYKHYIENFTNIVYDEISDLDRLVSEKSLIHLVEIVGIDISNIRRTMNMIVTINRSIKKIEEDLKTIEKDTVDNVTFRDIIYNFNEKLSNEIVYKGYIFQVGSGFGHIRIKKIDCRNRIKKRINWNLSNQKKAEILARGGTPYEVLERDENRKMVSHNGGEMWFVYFTNDFDYLWHWNKGRYSIVNSPYFKFRPTIYNNNSKKQGKLGNVNKLKQLVTANSPLLHNFLISHK